MDTYSCISLTKLNQTKECKEFNDNELKIEGMCCENNVQEDSFICCYLLVNSGQVLGY